MKDQKKPCRRLGDFAEERERIVGEYAKGNYLKTIADLAMEEEKRKAGKVMEKKKEGEDRNENRR